MDPTRGDQLYSYRPFLKDLSPADRSLRLGASACAEDPLEAVGLKTEHICVNVV